MAAHDDHDTHELAFIAKIAAWQAALDAYRAAKAADGGVTTSDTRKPTQNHKTAGFDLPVGALRNQTLPDAIKLYLAAGNRKQTNKEIAIGVKAGGLETGAANLEASVASSLFRMKRAGLVLRFEDGWDLAEHYPEHIRKKLETASVKPGRPKKRRRAKTEAEKPAEG